jgi:outer membrane protein assembly factor BamE (lipoprotein component of BamABCDE complex)
MVKMRNLINVVTLAVMLSLQAGCSFKSISHGQAISEDQANKIQSGVTTKEDIIMMFGEPSKMADDGKVFFYSWTRGSKMHVLGIGGGSAEGKSLVIVFDANGAVKKHTITRGVASGQQVD